MKPDLIGKIINTLLALLGIWTANKVSNSLALVGEAAQTMTAGSVNLPGRSK